ncbi:hypothetical protein [Breoghania sp.]|nr:hypothetical protein [Breoghania sp.]MDJ0931777.1 hypothetical protein [Breoghania sp.]
MGDVARPNNGPFAPVSIAWNGHSEAEVDEVFVEALARGRSR